MSAAAIAESASVAVSFDKPLSSATAGSNIHMGTLRMTPSVCAAVNIVKRQSFHTAKSSRRLMALAALHTHDSLDEGAPRQVG